METDRRRMLATVLALAAAGCTGVARTIRAPDSHPLRVTLVGQALLLNDVCGPMSPDFAAVVTELKRGDVVFTDLETTIDTPASGAATRSDDLTHTAPPAVLDCLKSVGFNLLALANNHAWDRGSAGVLATRAEVAARGFGYAGTGESIVSATAAGMLPTANGRGGLVAMAVGKIREGGAATNSRPGVNEVKLIDGRPDPADVERNLAAIRAAAGKGDIVIAYIHNHDWGDDPALIQPWSRELARQCIDAGARIFASHGAPLLKGIEWYRGCPMFHDLGSLFFQPRGSRSGFTAAAWDSVIAHCTVTPGEVRVELIPVILGQSDGVPRIANGPDAARVLSRLCGLSAPLGTTVDISSGRGWSRSPG